MVVLRSSRLVGAVAVAAGIAGASSVVVVPPIRTASFEVKMPSPIGGEANPTVAERFRMHALIAGTLTRLGEAADNSTVASRRDRLSVRVLGSSRWDVVRGRFRHRDPQYALTFAEAHMRSFLMKELEDPALDSEIDFLATQRDEANDERRARKAALRRFEEDHDIDSVADVSVESPPNDPPEMPHENDPPEMPQEDAAHWNAERRKRLIAAIASNPNGPFHPDVQRLVRELRDLDHRDPPPLRCGVPDRDDRAKERAELRARRCERLPALEKRHCELVRAHVVAEDNYAHIERVLANVLSMTSKLVRAQAAAKYDIVRPPHLEPSDAVVEIVRRSLISFGMGLVLGLVAVRARFNGR